MIRGIDSVPLFYSLEALGQLERLHSKVFEAANRENVIIGNPAVLNKWLEKNGLDLSKFEDVQKSFSVVAKINRARKMIDDYKIGVTPTIIVDGRYALTPGSETTQEFLRNVDRVIAQTRAKTKSTSTPVLQ